jgi:hypothetical protein
VSEKAIKFQVQGQPPLEAAAALFSNFLAVSRLGTEIQFEFVFLDLNQMALSIAQFKNAGVLAAPVVQGKTVAKVVMPAAAFSQLKEQFEKIFEAIEQIVPKEQGVENEHRNSANLG